MDHETRRGAGSRRAPAPAARPAGETGESPPWPGMDGAGVPGAPGGPARTAWLAYALAVLIIGTNLPTPLYAGYERAFGMSTLDVTLLVAVYAGTVTLSLLVCGPLSDSAGYRPVAGAGLAAAAVGAALLAAASGPGWLVAGRVVQGAAVGAASGPLTAGLVRAAPAGRPGRASLAAAVVTTAAVGAGPVLCGALAQFAPWPRVLPYLLEIVALGPALAAVRALPAGPGRSSARWRPRRPRLPARRRADFAASAAVALLGWGVGYVVLSVLPSYTADAVGRASLLVDGSAAGSMLLVAAAAQVGLRAWDAGRSQRAGTVLLVAGLVTLIAAGALGSGPLVFAAMAVAGAGLGTGFAGALSRVNEIAGDDERAGLIALFYVITYLGSGAAAAGAGLLSTALPLLTSVQVFAALFAVAGAAMMTARPGRSWAGTPDAGRDGVP